MSAASNLTSVAYIYKRLYTDRAVGNLAMRDHPLFKMMRKEGGFTGASFHYPIRYGNPQGISGLFADAQSGAESSKGVQLQMNRRPKYAVITLDGEAMAAAEGNKGAFLDLVTQETDGVIEEVGDTLAFDLFRAGHGRRGRRSALATNTVTLTDVNDARNFKIGMTVIASPNENGSSPRTGSTKVTAVDEDGGKITLADASAISGFVNNDYLFRKGDPGTCVEGLELHIPVTAPVFGSDSFRGIDRGADPRRLAGVRVDDKATSIEENAGLVAVKIKMTGKRADLLPLHPIKFWEVARRRDAKVTYDGGGNKASIGFQGFDLHTPAGVIRCVSEPDAHLDRAFVLTLSTWYIKHLKGFPHIVQDDGRPSLRLTSADAIEARVRLWGNLVCTEPGANGVFTI